MMDEGGSAVGEDSLRFALGLAIGALQAQEEHIRSLDARYGILLSMPVLIIAVLVGMVDGAGVSTALMRILYLAATACMFLAFSVFFYGFLFLRKQHRAPNPDALLSYLDEPAEQLCRDVYEAVARAWRENLWTVEVRIRCLKIGGFCLFAGAALLAVLLIYSVCYGGLRT